jgi:transcriptional regulator with XRE-family HTH domain
MISPIILTGRQVARARKLCEWSQQALADASQVGKASISRAEGASDLPAAISITNMLCLVGAFERAGVEFALRDRTIVIVGRTIPVE